MAKRLTGPTPRPLLPSEDPGLLAAQSSCVQSSFLTQGRGHRPERHTRIRIRTRTQHSGFHYLQEAAGFALDEGKGCPILQRSVAVWKK